MSSAVPVLVSGAHGFVGSHLCRRLAEDGHEVRALVSPWGELGNLGGLLDQGRLEVVRADVTDREQLRGVCEGAGAVVHAAALVRDWGRERPILAVNVEGTRNLLDEAGAAGVARFVLVSSVAVHRYHGFRNADPESLPRDNASFPYARSKILSEDLVLQWTARGAGEGVIVRPGLWPFGPHDPQTRRVAAALKEGRLPLLRGGRSVLNTAYVENLARGLQLAASVPGAGGRSLVVADEGSPTWAQALGELARLLGARPPRLSLPPALAAPVAAGVEGAWSLLAPTAEPPLTRYRASLMRNDVHFSLEKARNVLGYRPLVEWREGMARTVQGDPVLSRLASC